MGFLSVYLADELQELADWMRANGITHIKLGATVPGERDIEMSVCDKPEPAPAEPVTEFGIPEALQKAKDDEAQRLRDEKDRQWAEDQERYAHTEGYREA